MKIHKHECGCVSEVGDRERWVSMCPKHEEEFQATHKRWADEHKNKLNIVPGRKLLADDLPGSY